MTVHIIFDVRILSFGRSKLEGKLVLHESSALITLKENKSNRRSPERNQDCSDYIYKLSQSAIHKPRFDVTKRKCNDPEFSVSLFSRNVPRARCSLRTDFFFHHVISSCFISGCDRVRGKTHEER